MRAANRTKAGTSTKTRSRNPRGQQRPSPEAKAAIPQLPKTPSGIEGLDEITTGGLPKGRATLVCGGPGCGKTVLAMEFLVRGATLYDEPGVFMAFEETETELQANVASLGFDLADLQAKKKLFLDFVRVERAEIEETGAYDLEGLFVRLRDAIEAINAKRVVLDTLESLFAGIPSEVILRSELRRLFRWLKDRGMTVLITGEKGAGNLTRQGLEEYVSDCVIFLDHRINDQTSTRRLRIVKYRGSTHGTDEYPFLIGSHGISILPLTSLGLTHLAPKDRISTGISGLDGMLGGKGFLRGSTVLISGTAGTGKTSIASKIAEAACKSGQRCLFFAFEESKDQIVRNMGSISIDLHRYLDQGSLEIQSSRPTTYGLEMHLLSMNHAVSRLSPDLVVVDPITNLITVGSSREIRSMLTRLIDTLKNRAITACFTSLTTGGGDPEHSEVGISSLIDTWLMLEVERVDHERLRTIEIVKSRGMSHSSERCRLRLGDDGIHIVSDSEARHDVLSRRPSSPNGIQERTGRG